MKENGKINYIEMPARDIAATKQFFTTAFDWSFVDYGPDYVAIEDAGIDGGFYHSNQTANTEQGSVLVVLYSHTLQATLDRVVAAGGRIAKETFAFPGGYRFHFLDPNGNEFAVWSENDS